MPITIDVEVPNELHRLLAGQKRRELMQTYDVHILLPPNEDTSDIVKVNKLLLLKNKTHLIALYMQVTVITSILKLINNIIY